LLPGRWSGVAMVTRPLLQNFQGRLHWHTSVHFLFFAVAVAVAVAQLSYF